jgi:hypothetical protein
MILLQFTKNNTILFLLVSEYYYEIMEDGPSWEINNADGQEIYLFIYLYNTSIVLCLCVLQCTASPSSSSFQGAHDSAVVEALYKHKLNSQWSY